MRPALFLDRDGVIIANRADYIKSWQEVEFLPGALAALARLRHIPAAIVVVTNQSAVGRGILTLEQAQIINTEVVSTIRRAGGRIDAVYLCPHAPWEGCECRKPQPGLLFQAANSLELDLAASTLIGDALSDLQAAEAAGVPLRILVRTGRGQAQLAMPGQGSLGEYQVADNLGAAIDGWVHHKDKPA